MALTLYGALISPFVRKVRLALTEKGLAHEVVHIDPFNPPADYPQLNPLKRIPALVDGDLTLADSAVICDYLEQRYPQPALYPADPAERARALWYEKLADYEVAPWSTFTVFRQRVLLPLKGQSPDEDAIQKALNERLPPLFDLFEARLAQQSWLAGDALSVADLAITCQLVNFGYGQEQVDAARWPALAAHGERVRARASFVTVFNEEQALVAKLMAARAR